MVVGGRSVGIGLSLTYRYQRGALGIAHAIGLAREFAGDDPIGIVLGDNILHGSNDAGSNKQERQRPTPLIQRSRQRR